MTNQVDEKKYVIIALLIKLREFDPSIGKYISSSKTDDLEYSVKLHNGKIILSPEMIEDFERNNTLLNEKKLRMAAFNFIPDQSLAGSLSSKLNRSPFSTTTTSAEPLVSERPDNRLQKLVLISAGALLVVLMIYLALR